ncbi:hypothetical protein KR038_000419, partial [Drosophila bunnanda]
SPLPLPPEITPLEVVEEFVAAANSGNIGRELSDDCVLSFFGRPRSGATKSASFFRLFISGVYQHEGFEEANFVSPTKAEMLKVRFMRCFSWARQRIVEERKVRKRASSLHLRAESDDEDEQLPSRCRAQLVTPQRPASNDLDKVKFVEANGVLKSLSTDHSETGLGFGNTRTVHLTLGYRQLPLAFGNKRHIDICLAVYEKHAVATSSVPVPRRGSAASCNPPTDDEADDDSCTRRGVRRALFVELASEEEPEALRVEKQRDEPETQQEQQQALEHTPGRVEAITREESAQSSTHEESPAPSISSCTPRKRHIVSNGAEVNPKRTPRLNRLRF